MRNTTRIVALLLVVASCAWAQQERSQRIFQVKYADVRALAGILGVFNAQINVDANLKVIASFVN